MGDVVDQHSLWSYDGPLYYAFDGKVWKRPVKTPSGDGTSSINIGFPVCVMHDAAGAEAAATVAALMNRGEAVDDLIAAAQPLTAIVTYGFDGDDDALVSMTFGEARALDAALKKAGAR